MLTSANQPPVSVRPGCDRFGVLGHLLGKARRRYAERSRSRLGPRVPPE